MALYLKYRPHSFDSMVGQSHVVQTLQNAMAQDRISHAYLFAGPRGTGKTSLARILAAAVNTKGSTDTALYDRILSGQSLDIVEIDAASHTGVDNIRDLREKAAYKPSELKYKVFIIDEVHMLSKGAFNALLKTLEEPPEHLIFILATTEVHEIPATILSRCQRFDFRPLTIEEICAQLDFIASKEGVRLDRESLTLLAQLARGALRDAISLLEQIITSGGKSYSVDEIKLILGLAGRELFSTLFEHLAAARLPEAIQLLGQQVEQGLDPSQLIKDTLTYAHQLLLLQVGGDKLRAFLPLSAEEAAALLVQAGRVNRTQLLQFISTLIAIKADLRRIDEPLIALEVAMLESFSTPSETKLASPPVPLAVKPPKPSEQAAVARVKSSSEATVVGTTQPPAVTPVAGSLSFEVVLAKWPQILAATKPMNHSVEAFLKGGRPVELDSAGRLVIEFFYTFHKEQIDKSANRQIVQQGIAAVLGTHLPVICRLAAPNARPAKVAAAAAPVVAVNSNAQPARTAEGGAEEDELVSEALKIFGGKVAS